MKLLWKKLYGDPTEPKKAHEGDAGYDLAVIEDYLVEANHNKMLSTGIAVAIPEGYVGLIFPRSSTGKRGFALANTVGVIDAGYRGEVLIPARPHRQWSCLAGDRVAQLVVVPCLTTTAELVDELPDSTRGEGGFGSSGS